MTSRRSAPRSAALAAAALATLLLIVQLARPPAARDDSSLSFAETEPAAAGVRGEESPGSLPRPAPEAVAPLTTGAATSSAVDALVEPRRWVGGQVVRAADGTPLLGAVVRAVPAGATPGGSTQEPDARFKIWPRETTETLEVRLRLERGWPHRPQTFRIEPGSTDRMDLRLEYDSGFTLTGTVTDQGGRPVPRARLTVLPATSPIGGGLSTRTDERGRYLLQDLTPPNELGAISVAAVSDDHCDASALLPLTGEDPSVRTLDLQLQLGATIEAMVRLPTGELALDAVAMVLTDSGRSIDGRSSDDGIVRIGKLPAGHHTLVVGLSGDGPRRPQAYAPTRIDGVAVEAGQTTQLEVVLQPGATISGRVTDAAGNPIRKADVRLEVVEPPRGYRPADPSTSPKLRYDMAIGMRYLAVVGAHGSSTTDAGGNFELAGVPAGCVRVVAQAEGLVRESIELTVVAGEARSRVDFVLRPGFELAGRVTLGDGSPLQLCVKVLVLPADPESDEVLAMAETRMQGDFQADGIEPGPKRLLVVASDGSWVDAPAQPGGEAQTFAAHR